MIIVEIICDGDGVNRNPVSIAAKLSQSLIYTLLCANKPFTKWTIMMFVACNVLGGGSDTVHALQLVAILPDSRGDTGLLLAP